LNSGTSQGSIRSNFGNANALKAIEELNQSSILQEDTMRSELIFGAIAHVPNRFLLTKLAAKATRKFHRPNTRIQETTNEVFVHFSRSSPIVR
jgi:hypothetical protein